MVALVASASFMLPAALFSPTLGAAASTLHALPSDSVNVNIDMQEADGAFTIANAKDSGAGVNYPGGSAPAVMFQPTSTPQVFSIYTGSSCAGPWSSMPVGTATNPTTSATDNGPINLCTVNGTVAVHGTLTALLNSNGDERTVNTLPLEQYVADTVPEESPASWGSEGGLGPQGMPWGFQELEAQAIAARSYVLSNLGGYGGYADGCDLTCQTYHGTQPESSPTWSIITAAINDTAGQVMVMPSGQIATTEYSSSTGGYTSSANQESPFTAVPDDGDAVSGNTNHHWTTSVSYATLDSTWPQIGAFNGQVSATTDPGHPFDFPYGRIDTITLNGSAGSVTIPGTEFYTDLEGPPNNVLSDLFSITSTAGGVLSITGQGWGHGIGMGQWGALGYAIGQDNGNGNWTYSQIVNHYYAPAQLENLSNITTVGGSSGGVSGYWINATDGGVFSFGDAQFHGSTGAMVLNQPVVGMATTPDGGGYWLVASDGGIFAFGDAGFFGSLGAAPPGSPIVGVAPSPNGGGYWVLEANGTAQNFGAAPSVGIGAGSPALSSMTSPMVALIPDFSGQGFDAVDGGGQAFAYGDAPYFGDVRSAVPGYSGHAVGIAAVPG